MPGLAKEVLLVGAAGLTYLTGLAVLTRQLTRSKVPILTYHSVSESAGEVPSCLELTRMSVRPREFRRQMEYVARHYNTITLTHLLRARTGETTLPAHPCVITFDDGYLDTYYNGVPVLDELGLKATFFIIGCMIGNREQSWLHAIDEILDTVPVSRCASAFHRADPAFFAGRTASKRELCRLALCYFDDHDRATRQRFLAAVRTELKLEARHTPRFLSACHIRELHERGFEIGCHSMEHDSMDRLTEEELQSDIRRAKEVLGGVLGRPPQMFCYPIGAFDDRVIAVLEREGFTCAVTTIADLNDGATDAFMLRRMMVYTNTSFPLFVFRLLGLEAKSYRLYGFLRSPFSAAGLTSRPRTSFGAAGDSGRTGPPPAQPMRQ